MSGDRTRGRHRDLRAFRPAFDGGLESRYLMSHLPGQVFLQHPQPGIALKYRQPPFTSAGAKPFNAVHFPRGVTVQTESAHGGQSVIIGNPDGSHFRVDLTQFIPPPGEGQTTTSGGNVPGTQNPIQGVVPGSGQVQPIGTVRAYAMPGGKVGLILDGTTTQTEVDISNLPFPQQKSYAHSFAYGSTKQTHILNIGQIIVSSGQIGAILGYHTADLSGPLIISGTTPVDRIAFQDLLPGASITTGGDLNTLDVLDGVNLNSGTGITIGRDLNLINVGQDLDLSNGASITVGRFLGAAAQPPKGTATGSNFLSQNQALVGTGTSTIVPSLAGYIQGNFNIGAGSTFSAASGIGQSSIDSAGNPVDAVFLVNGAVNLAAPLLTGGQIIIPNINPGTQFGPTIFGGNANFVARNGYNPSIG